MAGSAPRRPTVKDVAAAAGVAPMTVSYTFTDPSRVADATRLRVREAAARLGYRPDATARALRSGRSMQLGVVIGERLSYLFDDPQAAQFLAGVADLCVSENLGVVLIPTRGDEGDVDRVLSASVDGYILWTTTADDPVLSAVGGSGRPAAIQGGPAHPGIIAVGPDDRAAASAVARAVSLAGATPVIISFPLDRRRVSGLVLGRDLPAEADFSTVRFPVTASRLAGYRDALIEAGHEWDVVRIAVVERNQREFGESAALALRETLPEGGALAVLAMSDELALGARPRLIQAGREVAVSGWDGSREAAGAGIWSVTASLREQGRACARAVISGGGAVPDVSWSVTVPDGPAP